VHIVEVSMLDIQTAVGIDTQNEFNKDFGSGSAMFIKCDVRKSQELEGLSLKVLVISF